MPLHVLLVVGWLKRFPPGRQSWLEGLAGLSLVGGGAAAWKWGAGLLPAHQLILWGCLLATAAVLFHRGWVKLLGPVLFYDMIRTARRRKHVVYRCLYSFLLIYLFITVYILSLEDLADLRESHWLGYTLGSRALGQLASRFCYFFLAIQMLVTMLLTPAYTAGAIAAEKERHTLDALFATDLRNREIVLSMFVSRLANLVLVLLTGLPILSVIEFLGGLDPNLVLAGFAFTALTMVSLGSLGILQSIRAPRPRSAVMKTYFWALIYLALALLSRGLLFPQLDLANFPSTDDWTSPVQLEDIVTWLNAGNPIWVVERVANGLNAGAPLDSLLGPALRAYAWFHGIVTVVCLWWAIVCLRSVALQQVSGTDGKRTAAADATRPRLRLWSIPNRVGAWPLLWKEIIVDGGGRRHRLGWLGFGIFAAVVFLPPVHLLYWIGSFELGQWREGLKDLINVWVRVVSVFIGCFMLLQVAVRAAGAISGERSRQTLDGLLSTPLESHAILFAKWLGSLLSPRLSWLLLAVVWALAVQSRGLQVWAIACFLLAWLVYAGFLGCLGLYFSVIARSTQRATLWTLVTIILTLAGTTLLAYDLSSNDNHWFSLLPPVSLGLLLSASADFKEVTEAGWGTLTSIGLCVLPWALAAAGFWYLANLRFRLAIGRAKQPRLDADQPVALAVAASEPIEQTTGSARSTLPAGSGLVQARWWRGPMLPPLTWPNLKLLRPLLITLLPCGLMVGWYAYRSELDRKQLHRAMAEADQLDPGWRLEELEARRPVYADDVNSAPQVTAAYNLIPRRTGDSYPLQRSEEAFPNPLLPPERLTDVQVQALTADLADARQAVTAARKLTDFPHGRFPIIWSKDYLGTLLPHTDHVRQVANLLKYDAMLRAHQGDITGALRSCRAILNANRSIGDEPMLISLLVRSAVRAVAVRSIERTLAQGTPEPQALADLQRLVEEEMSEPLLLFALRGERGGADRLLDALQHGTIKAQNLFQMIGPGGGGGFKGIAESLPLLFGGSLLKSRAVLLDFNTRTVEIAKLPIEQQIAQFSQLAVNLINHPLLVRQLISGSHRVALSHQRTVAELRATVVMLAAERFRQLHRRWPSSLSELVPGQLKEVPSDPVDGKPLRYRRLAASVVIYSIGSDGVDNGGTIRVGNFGLAPDWGVELWDPDKRRQSPQNEALIGPPSPPEK
jgi:ABC-type transport system involved in multi-copper enzyme maturation permease subunit